MPGVPNPYVRGVRTLLTALAALLAALAAGCQGETDLTFADEANSICEGQYADFANSLALTGYVSDREEDAAARQEREEASAEATAKLAELEPPAADADDFRAYLAERRAQQETAATARRALESGDTAGFRAADLALLGHDRRLRGFEERLGLDVCAQVLDEEAQDAVREVLEEAFLESDPGCDVFTVRFTREALGSPEACELLADDLLPDAISIRAVRGSEGEVASAEVRLSGGPDDGAVYGVRLLYERSDPVIADMLRISRRQPRAGS
jgi:hypothetical protein